MKSDTPTVFIVDDDSSVRDSLAMLVRSIALETETYGSAVDFLRTYDVDRCGCLLLDLRMPGMSGLDLQSRLVDMGSSLPIVFLSAHGDVSTAVQAMKVGAVDFIQKPYRDQELLDKIQHAVDEHGRLLNEAAVRQNVQARLDTLTAREREIMHMMVAGKANKVIASELRIGQRTVEIHRARVMEKTQATSFADLVRLVVESKR
jgi:two-component system, LuxR family, response regulator FixJ